MLIMRSLCVWLFDSLFSIFVYHLLTSWTCRCCTRSSSNSKYFLFICLILFIFSHITQVFLGRDAAQEEPSTTTEKDEPVTDASTTSNAQVEATNMQANAYVPLSRATSCVAPIHFKPTGGRAAWLFDGDAYPRPKDVCISSWYLSHFLFLVIILVFIFILINILYHLSLSVCYCS